VNEIFFIMQVNNYLPYIIFLKVGFDPGSEWMLVMCFNTCEWDKKWIVEMNTNRLEEKNLKELMIIFGLNQI